MSNSIQDEKIHHSLDASEKLALLERVAGSAHFGKSTRLRDFLRYVGRRSIKEPSAEIHEQEIGIKVFGRSAEYDRSTDNIVRVNATELRKRIDSYFATEGLHEPFIFSIPRGSYVPVFEPRPVSIEEPQAHEILGSPEVVSPVSGVPPSEPEVYANPQKSFWKWACLALVVVCAALLYKVYSRPSTPDAFAQKPTVKAFWTTFAAKGSETDIVLPDEAVSMSEEMIRRPMSLSEYIERTYQRDFETAQDISADRKADLRTVFNHNLVTFGGFQAAQRILDMKPLIPATHLVHARFYEPDSLKRNNLVLVGGKKANPWVHLFDDQINFSLDYDDAHWQAYVSNHQPKPGESAVYKVVMDRNALYGYATIEFLPSPSHTGSVLIIAGTDSDATAAAAEFLTSEPSLKKLQQALGKKDFPHFDLLLKTSRLSGTSFNAQLVAFRALP